MTRVRLELLKSNQFLSDTLSSEFSLLDVISDLNVPPPQYKLSPLSASKIVVVDLLANYIVIVNHCFADKMSNCKKSKT